MKHFVLSLAALAAGIAVASPAIAFDWLDGFAYSRCRSRMEWDGRCDQSGYLNPAFRDYSHPRQLGPNAYLYYREPRCAEEQYGYTTPGFNFFSLPNTFDPSSGQQEDCLNGMGGDYMSKRKTNTVQR